MATLEHRLANSGVPLQAIALIRSGLPCFPCYANKKPATPRGFKDAANDEGVAHELWKLSPEAPPIGVATGEVSGLDVLEIDPRHGGNFWFTEFEPRLPRTHVHRTRTGGFHFFFQHLAGLRCSTSKIAKGVDVRADGGYVIWWPATGLSVPSQRAPAPWPDWLSRRLSQPQRPAVPHTVVPDHCALSRLVRLVSTASEGQRNNLTFWAACRAGEMVASGLLEAEVAVTLIAQAAMSAGLSRHEAERAAWSGIKTTGGTIHG
jgi:hypothetical protein